MTAFELPANLVDSLGDEDGPRRAWLASLPGVVANVAERWSLELGRPFQPGGQCSWVAPARDASGRHLVLKVEFEHYEAWHEADGLRLWAGDGAVRLHAAQASAGTSILLLEQCVPGTSLRTLPEPEQDIVLTGLLRRLWREPPPPHPFRPLQTMCNQWAAAFETKLARRRTELDPGIVRAGMDLFRTMPATADRSVLLVTDLHAGNILAAEREPWLVIDPKPYVGDPAYDTLQHMLNCEQRLVADPVGLARRLADLLQLDPDRVLLWLFARCVQESLDTPVLGQVAARVAPS